MVIRIGDVKMDVEFIDWKCGMCVLWIYILFVFLVVVVSVYGVGGRD